MGTQAVVAVVQLDLAQVRGVAVVQVALPAFERSDRTLQFGVALKRVDGLHALEAITLDPRADCLACDAVEVNEHLFAQQLVELIDAGGVAGREPPQGDHLVRVVVVDVQVGVLLKAGRNPVDPLLER